MPSVSLPSATTCHQYQILPSAFQIAEFPTYMCWKALSTSINFFDNNSQNKSFKDHAFSTIAIGASYLGGVAALPITVCAAPVTLVADVIIGIAECTFCLIRRHKMEDIKTIAHRKILVSPCQHLAFCVGAIGSHFLCTPFLWFIPHLRLVPIVWTISYCMGQVLVGALPKNINHKSFNIFINGGCGEEGVEKWVNSSLFSKIFDQNKKPSTPNDLPKQERTVPPKFSRNGQGWNDFLHEEIPSLSGINDANLSQEYIRFKQGVLQKKSPEELLNSPRTQAELQKTYRKLMVILHPDKNGPRQVEATSLFKILQKAHDLVRSML